MSEQKGFWAILEIMGHQKFAGYVTEETIAGGSLVRIDIPETKGQKAFTKLFGLSSVYCITPVEEAVAKAVAGNFVKQPVESWDLPYDWQMKIQGRVPVQIDMLDEEEEEAERAPY